MTSPPELATLATSDIVEVEEGSIVTRFLLPAHDHDHIQGHIYNSGSFYELAMLRYAAAQISPGDVVIDGGAYVGNHTLYFANVCGARVVSFEPNAQAFEILSRNIALNDLADRVTAHNMGLGAAETSAEIAEVEDGNAGTARLLLSQSGAIRVVPLDDVELPGKPRMIKIDVEGMERAVLAGAAATIREHRPLIYVECASENELAELVGFLSTLDYAPIAQFSWTPTILFCHTTDATALLHRQVGMIHWREQLQLQGLRRRVSAVSEHLGELVEQTARLSRLISDTEERLTRNERALAAVENQLSGAVTEIGAAITHSAEDLAGRLAAKRIVVDIDRVYRKLVKLRKNPARFLADTRGGSVSKWLTRARTQAQSRRSWSASQTSEGGD